MKNYSQYSATDFLLDNAFVAWVKENKNDSFWQHFLQMHPEKKEEVQIAKAIILSFQFSSSHELTLSETESILKNVNRHIAEETSFTSNTIFSKKPNKRKYVWLQAAAVICIIVAVLFISRFIQKPVNTSATSQPTVSASSSNLIYIEKSNTTANPVLVKLSDESTVILKPYSRIRYPESFHGKIRKVELEGEAFFEVTPNKAQPFYVLADGLVTQVVGTSFSIQAFPNSEQTKVTVNTGKVWIYRNKKVNQTEDDLLNQSNAPVELTPNERVIFNKEKKELVKIRLQQPSYLSTEVTNVRFNFANTPFHEVVEALENAYDISIHYDTTLYNCPLTASLSTQHLMKKLELICKALEANLELVNGEIYIHGKGCEPQ